MQFGDAERILGVDNVGSFRRKEIKVSPKVKIESLEPSMNPCKVEISFNPCSHFEKKLKAYFIYEICYLLGFISLFLSINGQDQIQKIKHLWICFIILDYFNPCQYFEKNEKFILFMSLLFIRFYFIVSQYKQSRSNLKNKTVMDLFIILEFVLGIVFSFMLFDLNGLILYNVDILICLFIEFSNLILFKNL